MDLLKGLLYPQNNLKHWTKFQSEKKLLCWTPEKKKKDDKNKEEN